MTAFARYVLERFKQRYIQEIYMSYLADCMKMITENTAHFAGGGYIRDRWSDIIRPKPEEKRTASEIIQHMKDKLSR